MSRAPSPLAAVALLLLAGACQPGPPGPQGAMGERGEKGEQGAMGPAAKIPMLVVASNHVVIGPSLGGNVAFVEAVGGEVDVTRRERLIFESADCTGTPYLDVPVTWRPSSRYIGPDGAVLRPTGNKPMVAVKSTRSVVADCRPTAETASAVIFEDTGRTMQTYRHDEISVELR